jgi:aromatic ring hydroxylase
MKHFVAASCPRTPDSQNYMLVTYIDDPGPWEKAAIGADGRGLADNIRNFWQFAMDNDLVVAPHFVDPQADRSDPNAHATSPALRIVSSNDEGIIVRGVKAIGTATPFADYLHAFSSGPARRATRSSTVSARQTSKASRSSAATVWSRPTPSSIRLRRKATSSTRR